MKKLQWRQDNEYVWSLWDGKQFVGTVSYNASEEEMYTGQWGGTFHTSDGGLIAINPIGPIVLQAKKRIEENYLMDRDYEWWMR